MRTFRQRDVVRVPFPYTDKEKRQYRPALIVSRGGIGQNRAFVWVVMITSAANRGWPGDVSLEETYLKAGLPVPSVIRTTKIATIEAAHADRIGRLDGATWSEVAVALRDHLGLG
jgi:mRNA interferase MazF